MFLTEQKCRQGLERTGVGRGTGVAEQRERGSAGWGEVGHAV